MEKKTFVEKWYVVNTYSGQEYNVGNLVKERAQSLGAKDKIIEVLVPDEEKIEVRGNKRRIVQKKCFPGYVLIKVLVEATPTKLGVNYKMDSDVWYVIRNTEAVLGFVGVNGNPTPISEEEVEAIQKRMKRYSDTPNEEELKFAIGDVVEIINGSFMGSHGKVSFIDLEHRRVTVLVDIFSRMTPIEVNFSEIRAV